MQDPNNNTSRDLLESIPKKEIPHIAMAARLAFHGASDPMICAALGITSSEYRSIETKHPDVFRAIGLARAASFFEVGKNLYRLASESDDVSAIKFMMGLLGDEYKPQSQAATVNVQANTFNVALPSTKEALAYLESDPSIIEATEV